MVMVMAMVLVPMLVLVLGLRWVRPLAQLLASPSAAEGNCRNLALRNGKRQRCKHGGRRAFDTVSGCTESDPTQVCGALVRSC